MAIDNYDLRSSSFSPVISSSTSTKSELSMLIVRTTSGYAYISGGCDYTGWDCQSGAERFDAATQEAALALCSQDVRRVFEDMLVKGETVRSNTGGL